VTEYTLAGLFAGVGGVESGFSQHGFKAVLANEIDPNAAKSFNIFHPPSPGEHSPLVVGDIHEFATDPNSPEYQELNGIDVLTGGFPCQPFSLAGYRLGFEDPRGNVYWQIERLFRQHLPEVIFLENVANLLTHDGGRTVERVVASLEGRELDGVGENDELKFHRVVDAQPYYPSIVVANALDFGLPQNRKRVFIVAFKSSRRRDKFEVEFARIRSEARLTGITAIDDIIDFGDDASPKYRYGESHKYFELLAHALAASEPYRRTIAQWRRVYARTGKPGIAPTLTANMGGGGHNVPIIKTNSGVIRKLTPEECFRLQGFETPEPVIRQLHETCSDSALYKQAGNSVAIPVIAAFASAIRCALEA
jgi:DNA (cytosine-5)-methyltransferase 1